MQANSKQSGQLQNFTTGDGTSKILHQNIYQQCVPTNSAKPLCPGQTAPENYLTKITCTIQQANHEQNLTSSIQATKEAKPAQENQFHLKYALPTGNQDSQIILWNVPSNCQIFIPVQNINFPGASTDNPPGVSHCAFKSNSSLYVQQKTTSLAAGPNNSPQVKAKPIDTRSLNEAGSDVYTINLNNRQQHANAPNLTPGSSKTRLSLPSDLKFKPTENASQSNFSGSHYQVMVPEKSTHANVQTLSTYVQSTAAQRAIAVVTPLSPKGTAPVDATDESTNLKINARSVQETVQHKPTVPHTLEANTNLKNQTENKNEPTSKHQRPKSAEPRLNDGCGAESPVVTAKSIVRGHIATLPLKSVKSVVAELEESMPAQMQNEPSETINNCTEKKTVEAETIPFIKWPLDRLHTLTNMIQQIDNANHHKNVHKTDAGKEILKLYWDGDYRKFLDAVQTGIYENVMEEVFLYCSMKEPVILRQIKSDARNRVIKDFQPLKHNEEPPKMTYTSSWLNLNENIDDIDKECGYSWFYRSCQNFTEPTQNYATVTSTKFQEAAEMLSFPKCKPTAVENKVTEEATIDNKNPHENWPVVNNGQFPSAQTVNSSPKHNGMVIEKNKNQTNVTKSLKDMTTVVKDSDQQDVLNGMSSSENQHCNDARAKHLVLPKYTSQNDCTNSPKLNREFACTLEENSASALQSTLLPVSPLAEHNQGTVEMRKEGEEQTLLDKNLYSESLCKKSPPVTDNCPMKPIVVHKQVISQANTKNPLNGLTNLVRIIKKRQDSLKYKNLSRKNSGLKRKNQPRLKGRFCNAAGTKSPVFPNDTSRQSSCTNPLALSPEVDVQQKSLTSVKKGCSQILINSDCGTHKTTNEEEIVEMDTSAPVKIKVPPREMAQQYFVGQLMQEQNMTAQPKKTDCNYSQKGSMFMEQTNSESNTVHPLNGMTNLVRAVGLNRHKSERSKHQHLTAKAQPYGGYCKGATSPDVEVDSSTFTINILPHEVAKQCFAGKVMEDKGISFAPEMMHKSCLLKSIQNTTTTKGQISMALLEETDNKCSSKGTVVSEQTNGLVETLKIKHQLSTATARLDDNFYNGTKSPVLTDRSMNQSCNGSPPKLYPASTEPSQMLNESTDEMPVLDCVLNEDSVRCQTDPKSSQGLHMNTNEEINKADALDSIQISVLPHEMAELWFAGETENKDLNNDTGVHIYTKDQDKGQDLELKFNKEVVLEDVKPKRKSQSSSNEELDSFCCLAKWFQTLEYDNGSLCMCHEKSQLSQKENKPIHDSSLDVQIKEVEGNECELEITSETTEDSDTTEDSETEYFEIQEDSETKEDEFSFPKEPTMDWTDNKNVSRSEEACTEETERDESSLKCAANATLNHNEIKQDAQVADFKMKTNSIRLALYGSSSGTKKEAMPTKRYKGIENCEDPPETLQITITSNEKIKVQRKSHKCKSVESEVEDGVDASVPFKILSRCENLPSNANTKSQFHLIEDKKRKRQNKCTTQQMSMNKFVMRGKNVVSKLLHPHANVLKSKYELGNPALMPLEEGTALEFKVLPESFNFQDGVELRCTQGKMSSSTQNGTSIPDDDEAKRMKSRGSTIQAILADPDTSVSAERVFSTASIIDQL